MGASLKHKLINMFREIILYHSSSLAFRAKLLTLLVVGNGDRINECEEEKLQEIAQKMYPDDYDRAQVLIEAVHEFYDKITESNNLVYDSLIQSIEKDVQENPRFVHKIDTQLFSILKECIDDEEERIFHDRILSFFENLKDEYGEL
jgi:hypothetical protein